MNENIRMWRSISRSSIIVHLNNNFEIFDFCMFWDNIKMGTWTKLRKIPVLPLRTVHQLTKAVLKKNLFTCKGQGHSMLKFKICVKTGVFTCFETIFRLVNERTQKSN